MRRHLLVAGVMMSVLLLIGGICGRKLPTVPIKPIGPGQTFQGVAETYRTMAIDPGGTGVRYVFDWGDETIDTTAEYTLGGDTVGRSHSWNAEGSYPVKVRAFTEDNRGSSAWSEPLSVTVGRNTRPNPPSAPAGELLLATGQKGVVYSSVTDPEGDSVYIRFCRDTTRPSACSPWRGPVPGGTMVYDTVCYADTGRYCVAAYAKDTKGAASASSPVALVEVGARGIAWLDSSDNGCPVFSFPTAIYVGEDSTVWVFTGGDGDSVFLFQDDGGNRARQTRGSFNHGDGVGEEGPTLSADNQRVYFPVDDGRMYMLSNHLEEITSWAPDTSRRVFTMPAVNGVTLYAGRGDSLYCFTDNRSSFASNWAFGAGSEIAMPPVVAANGDVVFGTGSTGIYCVSPTGALVWNARLPARVSAGSAIGANGLVYVGCENGRLYGLSLSTGDSLFTSADSGAGPAGSAIVGSPVIDAGGAIYVCREEGSIAAYLADGSNTPPTWVRLLANSTFYSGPCLAPDTTIVVHTEEDYLYAIRTGDGSIRWPFKLPTATGRGRGRDCSGIGATPAIGPCHQRIYVASAGDRYFFAVSIGEESYKTGMPEAQWPTLQHDNRRSGYAGSRNCY